MGVNLRTTSRGDRDTITTVYPSKLSENETSYFIPNVFHRVRGFGHKPECKEA